MSCCYLIHFDRPLHHARHYLGWTKYSDPWRRVTHHFNGQGARLTKAAKNAGIKMTLVRIWEGGDRALEIFLKRKKGAKFLCPLCNYKLRRHLLRKRKMESVVENRDV